MTPTTDDQGRWLDGAIAIIVALWAALGYLYWKLWDALATREWVLEKMDDEREKDEERDRQLIADTTASLRRELEIMHGQNASTLGAISGKLDILLQRKGNVPVP